MINNHSLNQSNCGVVRAVSVNPGAVNSDIWRSIPAFLLKYVVGPIFRLVYLTTEQGAATSVAGCFVELPPINGDDAQWDRMYLQPYAVPPWSSVLPCGGGGAGASPSQSTHSPVFETLGYFVGYRQNVARIPGDGDESVRGLREESLRVVGLVVEDDGVKGEEEKVERRKGLRQRST
jgi:hypothetical protein